LQEALFRFGRQAAADAFILAQADDYPERAAAWDEARKCLAETLEPRLPFSGADLIARGMSAGTAIGEALKELEAAWIRAGFPTDPAHLDRLLEGTLRKGQARQETGTRCKC
jgi:poly(A) polymerase